MRFDRRELITGAASAAASLPPNSARSAPEMEQRWEAAFTRGHLVRFDGASAPPGRVLHAVARTLAHRPSFSGRLLVLWMKDRPNMVTIYGFPA
jgi:hypothetical protein